MTPQHPNPPLKPSAKGHAARALLVFVAWLVSLGLVAVAAFLAVLLLAGPHGGLLPGRFEPVVPWVGWGLVLVLPLLAARWTWRRLAHGS